MGSVGPRTLTPQETWQITCHEAGHAVAGVRLDVPFEYVERGDGEKGEVESGNGPIDDPEDNWTDDELARWQQFYAAGAAAEKLLFGDYRQYASVKDQSHHNTLEKRCRNRSDGWEQDIQSALNILDRGSIEIVAKELDRQRKLTEEQVCQLLLQETAWARVVT